MLARDWNECSTRKIAMNWRLGAVAPLDPYEAIQRAEKLLLKRDYKAAHIELAPARAQIPDNYWVNLLSGRIYAGLGQKEEMLVAWRTAIASGDPSRIGAICDLVHYEFTQNNFDSVPLLDEALALCETSNQKEWYFAQLLLLKALVTLRSGQASESEHLVRCAYEFRRHFGDELDFAFPWAAQLLTVLSLEQWPCLEYIKQRLTADQEQVDYKLELQRMPERCSVLEIGAMDGVRFDELREHILTRNWDAILVEPLADMFEILVKNYRSCPNVRCANVAITNVSGPVTMYRVTPETAAKGGHDDWVLGLSAVSKSFLLEMYEGLVTEEIVAGVTFAEFVASYDLHHIDVLQIDTEGHDLDILRQIDLSKWRVPLVRIEILHLLPPDRLEVFRILRSSGYRFSFNGGDVTGVLPIADDGLR
jgi:FkbM family methyltransferase